MAEKITDRTFVIYKGSGSYLGGEISNGALKLDSEIYGDDFDSEQHLEFSVEDTKNCLSLCLLIAL